MVAPPGSCHGMYMGERKDEETDRAQPGSSQRYRKQDRKELKSILTFRRALRPVPMAMDASRAVRGSMVFCCSADASSRVCRCDTVLTRERA